MSGFLAGENIKEVHGLTNSFHVILTGMVMNSVRRVQVSRSLPGTTDKTGSGFDKPGERGPLHPALGRGIQGPLRTAAALRPHKKNTISMFMLA